VTRDHVLVTGECRLLAVKKLAWEYVPVQFTDELSVAQLKAIELEENVKRRDLDWQDRVQAVQEFHMLQRSETPEWSMNDTARELGFSPRHINSMLDIAYEIAAGNERVMSAPKLSTARGIVERAKERADEQTLKSAHSAFGALQTERTESILIADFNEWISTHVEPRFNLIHCDFPYGVGADTFNQGAAPAHGGYEDSREVWERLMLSLAIASDRHTTPSAHLMFWFAMRKRDERLYEPTVRALERMGWTINPLPLIWMKSDGIGIIPDPERGPRQIYETCLFGSRGDRKIVRAVANAHSSPSVRDKHMSEKPEPMLRHFFQMFVDENTVMLDPTCGSGSALRAAESLGAKYALGLEVNPEFATLAREALEKARKLRKATEIAYASVT
jgi:16S rRNA G966 N2-methylase RsmD